MSKQAATTIFGPEVPADVGASLGGVAPVFSFGGRTLYVDGKSVITLPETLPCDEVKVFAHAGYLVEAYSYSRGQGKPGWKLLFDFAADGRLTGTFAVPLGLNPSCFGHCYAAERACKRRCQAGERRCSLRCDADVADCVDTCYRGHQ